MTQMTWPPKMMNTIDKLMVTMMNIKVIYCLITLVLIGSKSNFLSSVMIMSCPTLVDILNSSCEKSDEPNFDFLGSSEYYDDDKFIDFVSKNSNSYCTQYELSKPTREP